MTDGFSGNIALKTAEGTANLIKKFFLDEFSSSISGIFMGLRRPMNIPDIDELNSSKKNFLIKFAVPSAVFKAMFPLKPSVTITSALAEEKSLPSTNPTYSISPFLKV